MTFLFCGGLDEFDVVRQKGDADLFVACQHPGCMTCWRAKTYEERSICKKHHVSYPGCYDACCGLEGHEPTWTIS
jgi:hypothetical protein